VRQAHAGIGGNAISGRITQVDKEKTDIRLLIRIAPENNLGEQILRYTAMPVIIKDGAVSGMGTYGPGSELDDFQVEAWRDTSHDFYHAQFGYRDVYRISLTRAEEMVRILRKVDRKTRQLSVKYGGPESAATTTAYVAEALGITAERPFIRRVPPEQDYDGTGYRNMNAAELDYHVRSESGKWAKEHGAQE
jgi:hypothetical protein